MNARCIEILLNSISCLLFRKNSKMLIIKMMRKSLQRLQCLQEDMGLAVILGLHQNSLTKLMLPITVMILQKHFLVKLSKVYNKNVKIGILYCILSVAKRAVNQLLITLITQSQLNSLSCLYTFAINIKYQYWTGMGFKVYTLGKVWINLVTLLVLVL